MKMNANLGFFIFGGVLLLIVLLKSAVVIPAGHIGVKSLFGRIKPEILYPGVHVVNPLLTIYKLSTQTQNLTEQSQVASKEGLIVDLDVTLLFKLNPVRAPEIMQNVGKGYVATVVEPEIRSMVRGVTASFEAKALYTQARETLTAEILDKLKLRLEQRGIIVEEVLLRSIALPRMISEEIQRKLQAEQQAEAQKHVLQKEQLELEIKKVKAQGIMELSKGLTETYLKWEGIQATSKLADSANTKVIVIGSGNNGLPLILNGN